MHFAKFGKNCLSGSREEILSMYFLSFVIHLSSEKVGVLHLFKFKFPSPKDTLCKVRPSSSEDFKISTVYFCYFVIISS